MSELISFPTRPKVKPIYEVLYLNGSVRLGFGPSFTSEIDDPDGTWAQLIRLLDGTRTIADLTSELAGVVTPEKVEEGISAMFAASLIEDADTPLPPNLSVGEAERYRANLNFFRTVVPPGVSPYGHQASLKDLRVTVLGAGGIGSNVCMALAELGVGSLTILDFDLVELSNLNRQVLYSTAKVGTVKAFAAKERINEFNPHVDVTAHQKRITSLGDVEELLDESRPDFVFCLADKPNGFIDFWVNEACVKRGVPYAAGSVACHVGTMYMVLPKQGPCYQCRVTSELEGAPELETALDYVRGNEVNSSNGAIGPACMFVSYFLTYEMLRWRLEGLGPVRSSASLLEIDLVTFEQKWHDFEKKDDCAICNDET
jgi:molybdopterin-synthase adenylyltransferase